MHGSNGGDGVVALGCASAAEQPTSLWCFFARGRGRFTVRRSVVYSVGYSAGSSVLYLLGDLPFDYFLLDYFLLNELLIKNGRRERGVLDLRRNYGLGKGDERFPGVVFTYRFWGNGAGHPGG